MNFDPKVNTIPLVHCKKKKRTLGYKNLFTKR